MIAALLLCLVALPQEPVVRTQDVVHLKVGGELSGRIVKETRDYVEIELGDGSVIGMEKSRTTAIVHGVSVPRTEPGSPVPPEAPRFRERDQWNVLHGADGKAAGWMHATLSRTEDGRTRIGEEWRFVERERTVETTVLEVVDPDGQPRSAFCHERLRLPDGRISGERLVHAVVEDGQLVVSRRSSRGQDRQVYDFPPGTRFPLELREELRMLPTGAQGDHTHVVFDPLLEQFVDRTYDVGRTRRVDLGRGRLTHVRVLSASSGHGENVEWLDAAARPLRTEVAGPALVAVPVDSEADARRQVKDAATVFPPAFRTDLTGEFGLWLPSPVWRFEDTERDGEITACAALDDASVALMRLPWLSDDLGLPSVGDAVVRWLRLANRELRVVSRESVTVRGLAAERIHARALRYDGVDVELLVHVLRCGDDWFASCGSAPRVSFSRIEPELVWMVERFELRRDGFAPELQGPFANGAARRLR